MARAINQEIGRARASGSGAAQIYRDTATKRYVVEDSDGEVILPVGAGSLNLFGHPVSFSEGERLFLGPTKDWRIEPDTHRDGVLFIE